MQHLIVDLKRWYTDCFDIYAMYEAWYKGITPKTLKNHHQVYKWFDSITKMAKGDHSVPVSADVVDFDGKAKGVYVCAFEYGSSFNGLRFHVASANVQKKGIWLQFKSLPYLFTEHFFQRIVDRKAVHDQEKLLNMVFDEYKEKQGLITLLYGYASLHSDAIYFPVPFLGGVALINAVAGSVNDGYIVHSGLVAQTNGTIKTNPQMADPIHSRKVNDSEGNEYYVGLRLSTWISRHEVMPAQEKFCQLVHDFYAEHIDFLGQDMNEHLSGRLCQASQAKYTELLDLFSTTVDETLSLNERKATFFEPKAAKFADKIQTI